MLLGQRRFCGLEKVAEFFLDPFFDPVLDLTDSRSRQAKFLADRFAGDSFCSCQAFEDQNVAFREVFLKDLHELMVKEGRFLFLIIRKRDLVLYVIFELADSDRCLLLFFVKVRDPRSRDGSKPASKFLFWFFFSKCVDVPYDGKKNFLVDFVTVCVRQADRTAPGPDQSSVELVQRIPTALDILPALD